MVMVALCCAPSFSHCSRSDFQAVAPLGLVFVVPGTGFAVFDGVAVLLVAGILVSV